MRAVPLNVLRPGPWRRGVVSVTALVVLLVASPLFAPTSATSSTSFKISFSQTYSVPAYPPCVDGYSLVFGALTPSSFGLGTDMSATSASAMNENDTVQICVNNASGSSVFCQNALKLTSSSTPTELGTYAGVAYKAEVQLDAAGNWSISVKATCPCSGKFPC